MQAASAESTAHSLSPSPSHSGHAASSRSTPAKVGGSMSLREWYGEREILVTGVTGELGRNLLEKLLRSFPGVRLHLVLRTRHGMNHADRVKKRLFNSPGYERLRQERPEAMARVKTYEGNLAYWDLGLQPHHLKAMANVTVAFHAGGPSEHVIELCKELPKLQSLVVVDTIFRFKEDQVLESALEENVPNDLPLAYVRLPAVGPALREPMPGYVYVLTAPTAMLVGAGYMYGRGDLPVEIIPVDVATNTLIAAARDVVERKGAERPIVYNAGTIDCSWSTLISKGDRANRKYRYPSFSLRGITSSKTMYWFVVIFFELLPAYFCDICLYLLRQETSMVQEHYKIQKLLKEVEPITFRTLTVERRKMIELDKRLSPEDKELFPVRVELDIEAYILCAAAATRRYCVDEKKLKIVTFFLPAILAVIGLGCSLFYYSYFK